MKYFQLQVNKKEKSACLDCVCTFQTVAIEPTSPCPVYNISQCDSCEIHNGFLNCKVLSVKIGNSMCLMPSRCYKNDQPKPSYTPGIMHALLFTFVAFTFIFVIMAYALYKKRISGQADISSQIEMLSMDNESFNYGSFE